MKQERKHKGLNTEQMAKRLDISRRTYHNWEQGQCTLAQFIDVCNILELKIHLISQFNTLN